jgi:putative tryptophan/tyrosine transport system substrate-binding protein
VLFLSSGASHALGNLAPLLRRRGFFFAPATAVVRAWVLVRDHNGAREPSSTLLGYLSGQFAQTELSRSVVRGLRELGYTEGQNIVIEYRLAMGRNERLNELAEDLVRSGIDLILTEGTPSTQAAIRAAKGIIPVVFGSMQDPVEKGFVASLARPGGNATGNALIGDHIKPLALLKEAVPTLSRVAFVYDPATRPGEYGQAKLAELQSHARTLGIAIRPVALRSPADLERTFTELPEDTDALLLENSVVNIVAQKQLCGLANGRKLPSAGTFPDFSRSGCLVSYGENLPLIYRNAASFVDKILRDGVRPGDLPVQHPSKFELVVNLRTAKALGIPIAESFLVLADEVIE